MNDKSPLVSVIMPCYNREKYVVESIESILNQTYTNFEFIIIDDCSTDKTFEVVKEYAEKDKRILPFRNDKNYCYVYSLNKALKIAKGKYIARMDDDDISLPERLKKQVDFLENNEDIAVLGTFIEIFDNENNRYKSWIIESDNEVLKILMTFFNPICHPSVMIRKDFLEKYNITYSKKHEYSEDYIMWKTIIENNGKISNIPEILLKYRRHYNRVSEDISLLTVQRQIANDIRMDLLSNYFDKELSNKIISDFVVCPIENNNSIFLYKILKKMEVNSSISKNAVNYLIEKYCGIESDIHIFFASDDNYAKCLCVAIASILINSLPIDHFNFYILDGGISSNNKKNIIKLKQIKDFNVEFIKIDDNLFNNCPITEVCKYITKTTYYRYIIPKIKPELKKCFYFDCDIIVTNSLNLFWNTNIDNYYIAAVEELWDYYHNEIQNILNLNKTANAGILLINIEKWINDNIIDTLFDNTSILIKENKLKWQDQDVINYTFKDNIYFISPKYNLQQTAYFDGQHSLYSDEEMNFAKQSPVIIHYSGDIKPWQEGCRHPLAERYWDYIKYTPYKKDYKNHIQKNNSSKKWYNYIFSIEKNERYEIIRILGIKITIKSN